LLIVQAAPNHRHLLTSSVSSNQLQAIAQEWSHETIQAGLSQLHTSEGQLRFSVNAQVWLEVCLLNLLPKLVCKSKAASSAPKTLTQRNGNGRISPESLWQQVIDVAPGNAKRLLSRARMQSFNGNHAVFAVEERYLEKFEANAPQITRLIRKVAGGSNSVSLEFKLASLV
jgi:DNA polymerase-3 subunit gamma/tau